jgi:hypothetical protein
MSDYPRKQILISYAADCDVIVCYGGAKPTDKQLASAIHCVDDEIIGWLKRRHRFNLLLDEAMTINETTPGYISRSALALSEPR